MERRRGLQGCDGAFIDRAKAYPGRQWREGREAQLPHEPRCRLRIRHAIHRMEATLGRLVVGRLGQRREQAIPLVRRMRRRVQRQQDAALDAVDARTRWDAGVVRYHAPLEPRIPADHVALGVFGIEPTQIGFVEMLRRREARGKQLGQAAEVQGRRRAGTDFRRPSLASRWVAATRKVESLPATMRPSRPLMPTPRKLARSSWPSAANTTQLHRR